MSSALSLLPKDLPSVAKAKLPAIYQSAKTTLAECSRIDECKDWADKSEALASYAKQSGDESLRQMADRIQARAIRRCGELLREFRVREKGGRPEKNGKANLTVSGAAEEAGLSIHQKRTATRVANVPDQEFEAAIESDNPPTVNALADIGKHTKPKSIVNLRGRDPKEFALSTHAQGQLRQFAEFSRTMNIPVAVRGAFPNELQPMIEDAEQAIHWLTQLLIEIEEQQKCQP